MEGFHAAVGNNSSRAFFLLFHISTVIVLTVTIAFIVEAFVFKIHFAHQRCMAKNRDDYTIDGVFLKCYEVSIKEQEIEMIEKEFNRAYWPWELQTASRKRITPGVPLRFQGIRRRTKGDLHKQLYKDHLMEWIEEDKKILESEHNQIPLQSSSTTLLQRLKSRISSILAYIFE